MRLIKILLLSTLLAIVTGCSSSEVKENLDVPEYNLYQEALRALEKKNYSLAITKLEMLEARFPFGTYSAEAQLELMYAYFKDVQAGAAISAADRFIRLHPNHPNLDYVYYLKGLTAFEKDRSILLDYLPLDESKRDPGAALDGLKSFQVLLKLFPRSQYAHEARKRMIHLKNRLARYEVNVAHYYIQRGAYLAAVNRGLYVIENFQKTPAVADALAAIVEAYRLIGEQKLADDYLAVLNKNYKDYQYKTVKEEPKTLLDAITFDLLRDKKED